MAKKVKSKTTIPDYFLVCALERLGQQAIIALKRFGVPVLVIEQQGITRYQVSDWPDRLERLGDRRNYPLNHRRFDAPMG